MKNITFIFLLVLLYSNVYGEKYIFFLHNKFFEDAGAVAVNKDYGPVNYYDLVNAFKQKGFTVISELRKKDTNGAQYAEKVATEIDSMIKSGVDPSDITVVGTSKGSIIAMLVSVDLQNKDVNYVFIGDCDDEVFENIKAINFCGNILSIYEKTDEYGQTCIKFKNKSTLPIPHYKEIELNTGLKHGFLYKPLPEWVNPSIKWASGDYN